MVCLKCGKKIEGDEYYCPECYLKIKKQAEEKEKADALRQARKAAAYSGTSLSALKATETASTQAEGANTESLSDAAKELLAKQNASAIVTTPAKTGTSVASTSDTQKVVLTDESIGSGIGNGVPTIADERGTKEIKETVNKYLKKTSRLEAVMAVCLVVALVIAAMLPSMIAGKIKDAINELKEDLIKENVLIDKDNTSSTTPDVPFEDGEEALEIDSNNETDKSSSLSNSQSSGNKKTSNPSSKLPYAESVGPSGLPVCKGGIEVGESADLDGASVTFVCASDMKTADLDFKNVRYGYEVVSVKFKIKNTGTEELAICPGTNLTASADGVSLAVKMKIEDLCSQVVNIMPNTEIEENVSFEAPVGWHKISVAFKYPEEDEDHAIGLKITQKEFLRAAS